MKTKIIKYSMILIAAVSFAGCYTIMWTPDKEFPAKDENSSYSQDTYYNDQYYGDYSYYYEYPWWYSIIPPAPYNTPGSAYVRDSSGAIQGIRNNMGGRGTAGRTIINTSPAGRIISNPGNSSDNTSANNSGSSNSNYNRTETTNSGSGNSAARSSSSQRDNSKSARNNDGGRNNNGRKR